MKCWASSLTLTFGRTTTAQLSVLRARRPHFTPKEIPWYSLMLQAVWTSCYWMRTEGIDNLKIFNHPTGNGTRNLMSCGAVPQPTAAPLAPVTKREQEISVSFFFLSWYFYNIYNIIKPITKYTTLEKKSVTNPSIRHDSEPPPFTYLTHNYSSPSTLPLFSLISSCSSTWLIFKTFQQQNSVRNIRRSHMR